MWPTDEQSTGSNQAYYSLIAGYRSGCFLDQKDKQGLVRAIEIKTTVFARLSRLFKKGVFTSNNATMAVITKLRTPLNLSRTATQKTQNQNYKDENIERKK